MGLTQAGLLHYFRFKPELLIAVLNRRDGVDAEMLGLLDVDSSSGRGLAALDRLVDLVELNAKRRGIVQLFTVIVGEAVTDGHPARDWATGRYTMIRGSLVGALHNGIADGTVHPDTDVVASDTVALMDGLQIQWLLDPTVDMAGTFRRYVEAIKASLAP